MTSVSRFWRMGAAAFALIGIGVVTPIMAQTPSAPTASGQTSRDLKSKAQARTQKASPKSGAAAEQARSGPAPIHLKLEPAQPDWTKVCGKGSASKGETCYTTRDFVSGDGRRTLSVAVYDVKAPQPRKVVRFLMPLGLLLQPGIRFQVGKEKPTSGRYGVCIPNGCFAEAQVKDEFVASLRKGAVLNVAARNQQQQVVTLTVPTAGFEEAYLGDPIDPQVLAQRQKSLLEALEKRSDELRQRLLRQSGHSVPSGASADAKSNDG